MNTTGWVGNDGTYLDQEIGTGWSPSKKVRLFPNDPRIRFEEPVHELVENSLKAAGIPIKDCEVPIHHYGKLDMTKVTKKAEQYCELGKAKFRSDSDLLAIYELALQASELGRYEDALVQWNKFIAFMPDYPKAFYGLGYAHYRLKHFQEAFSAWRLWLHPRAAAGTPCAGSAHHAHLRGFVGDPAHHHCPQSAAKTLIPGRPAGWLSSQAISPMMAPDSGAQDPQPWPRPIFLLQENDIMIQAQNFIAGAWSKSANQSQDINPSNTGDVVGEFPQGSAADAQEAIAAAKAAFPAWSRSTVQQRHDVLKKIGDEITARKDIGRLLSREEGKTLAEGIGETMRAGQIFLFFAGETLRLAGEKLGSVRPGVDYSRCLPH